MRINNRQELKEAIEKLEVQKKLQEQELIIQFHNTAESFKPSNIIKSAIENIAPAGIISSVLKTAGSIGVGLLTNKLVGGAAAGSAGKKIFSSLLSQTASKSVVNNIDTIKAYGTAIIHNLFPQKKNYVE